MKKYIIRHAQSENNALSARTSSGEGRSADPPLTDIGQGQARQLAQHLAQTNSKPGVVDQKAEPIDQEYVRGDPFNQHRL